MRGWHNWLRSLCLRAHPNQEPDDLADLIGCFSDYIADTQISREVSNANPVTYAGALEEVMRRAGNKAKEVAKPRGLNTS